MVPSAFFLPELRDDTGSRALSVKLGVAETRVTHRAAKKGRTTATRVRVVSRVSARRLSYAESIPAQRSVLIQLRSFLPVFVQLLKLQSVSIDRGLDLFDSMAITQHLRLG